MLVDALRNIAQVRRMDRTASEKMAVYLELSKFLVKKKIFQKINTKRNIRFHGLTVLGYDYVTLDFLYREIFLHEQYRFNSKTTKPVIIDCGSNIGISVLYFKKYYPNSKVIAFEANPFTFELLNQNIIENNLDGVERHNVVLWDEDTTVPFFISENIGTLLGSVRADRGGESEFNIKSVKLSDTFKEFDAIDLVKIDVEGAESRIVNDLIKQSVIQKAERYIIEYHHNIGGDRSKLAEFLTKFESHGYNYVIKESYTDPTNFQDLLIYFYKDKP